LQGLDTMARFSILQIALCVILGPASERLLADDRAQEPKLQEKIIGSWKLVSARYGGQDYQFPSGSTMIKHVTPSQFMWVTYDKDGKMTRAAGGNYSLKGDQYEEFPEYGFSDDFEIIKGKTHTFLCKIDKNTWHHDGKLSNGQTIEEIWERIEKK
jgi:hypothetical protein